MLERLDGGVDAFDCGDDCVVVRCRAVDEGVAIAGGDRCQPAAQLVGAVSAQLALVPCLDRGAAAAAAAQPSLAFVEFGELGGLASDEGAAAASMRASKSSVAATTVAPVPSMMRGSSANARRRSANWGSAASRRARVRSPPAAEAAAAACPASVPSTSSRASRSAAAIGPNSTRTHRDTIVTRSTGTKSARTTKWVDAGGSSIVFSSRPAPTALSRWNSWRMSTLRSPSTGDRAAWRTISAACSAEIAGPRARSRARRGARRPAPAWRHGCRPPRSRSATGRRRHVPLRPWSCPVIRRTGRREPAPWQPDAAWPRPDPDRRRRPRSRGCQARTPCSLSRCRTASSTWAATSSLSPSNVMTIQRSGSPPASRRYPSSTR